MESEKPRKRRILLIATGATIIVLLAATAAAVLLFFNEADLDNRVSFVHPSAFTEQMRETGSEENIRWNDLNLEGRLVPDDPGGGTTYYVPTDLETARVKPEEIPEKMKVYEFSRPSELSDPENVLEIANKLGFEEMDSYTWGEIKKDPGKGAGNKIDADELIAAGEDYPDDIVAYSGNTKKEADGAYVVLRINGITGRVQFTNTSTLQLREEVPIPPDFDVGGAAIEKLKELGFPLPPHPYVASTGGSFNRALGEEPVQLSISAKIRGGIDGYSIQGGNSLSYKVEFDALGTLVRLDCNWPTMELVGSYSIKTPQEAVEDLLKDKVYTRNENAAHVMLEDMELCYLAEPPARGQTRLEPAYLITGSVLRKWSEKGSVKESEDFKAIVSALK